MRLTGLLPLLATAPAVSGLRARLGAGSTAAWQGTTGVPDAAKPALIAALIDDAPGPVLIVTPRPDRAAALADELALYLTDPERLFVFPELDTIPYERVSPDTEAAESRLRVLQLIATAHAPVPLVVTCGMALAQGTLPPQAQREGQISLAVGTKLRSGELLTRLQALGYEAVSLVDAPGQFSRRGGIIDLFPPAHGQDGLPARIELLGDRIDSLRLFNPATQRTVRLIERVEAGPAREAAGAGGAVEELLTGLDLAALSADIRQRFQEEGEQLRAGDLSAGGGFYLPFLATASLLDYFPPNTLVIVDELADLSHAIDELDAQALDARGDLEQRGLIPPGLPLPHFMRKTVIDQLQQRSRLLQLHRWASEEPADESVDAVPFRPAQSYGGRLRVAMHDALQRQQAGARLIVTSQQSARLAEILREEGRLSAGAVLEELTAPPPAGSITLLHGSLGNGWSIELPDGSLQLVTDTEVFGFTKVRRPQRSRAANRDAFLADLSPGDHVVHIEHGIALFNGLVRRDVDGIEREYLDLRYADGDRLLVPTDQVDRVTRFIGPSDRTPVLSRLGTTEWQRAKDRVRRAVTDLAQDLLNLYAQREVLTGHAFPPDQPWQQELEAAFPYVETPDQIRTIAEVKADMELPRPMDRVIVGDVGYGKTEIAIRAAFKAVLDGTQVAMLVPTTVLAEQHGQTFRERLSGFPTRVEVLSRFRSEKEQRQIVAAAVAGEVDILIGTHRLLGKDVQFKKLGLVVIDEEQRFGVTHKEWLRRARQEVDTLSLSATPIPRTLHMSLSGIRDLSTVNTAPEERLPIKTYVAEFDERLVREAILRELDRDGQVYFVHNRVQSIERIAADLRRIVPEAEIGIGHGQMPEGTLEQVMLDFQRGRYDVLVCSTIIESGLDIPSTNTIIINQSDRLGLAQLYQLRGRVGRGANRAYAYLLYERNHALTETAQKRLQTIFEATELGAGFQIALRDLEIRGAGNLLGAEQSGHIGMVGFDLYSRMLGDAVGRLRAAVRGDQPPPPADSPPAVQLDLPLAAYIPESYVTDLNARLALYQRMGRIDSSQEAATLAEELDDRFGVPPPAVRGLLYALALKSVARRGGVLSILREEGMFVLRRATPLADREALQHRFRRAIEVGTTQVRLPVRGDWLALLYQVTSAIAGEQQAELPAFAAGALQPAGDHGGVAAGPAATTEPAWQRPSRSGPFPLPAATERRPARTRPAAPAPAAKTIHSGKRTQP